MRSSELVPSESELRAVYLLFRKMAERFPLAVHGGKLPHGAFARREFMRDWVEQTDEAIQAYHLRLFLQTGQLCNADTLRALIGYYREKRIWSGSDRDKLDFLLVQYLALCAPETLLHHAPSFAEVIAVLEPVLGEIPAAPPAWLEQVEDTLQRVVQCQTLRALLRQGVLYELRKLKMAADESYFGTAELAAFARVNFLVRQTFFRLIQNDVEAVRQAIGQLKKDGAHTIDCRRAKLSAQEPLARILQLTQCWEGPFQAAYSAGHPLSQLGELREAIEENLRLRRDPRLRAPAAPRSGSRAARGSDAPALVGGPRAPVPAPGMPKAATGIPASLPLPTGQELNDSADIMSEILAILQPVTGTAKEEGDTSHSEHVSARSRRPRAQRSSLPASRTSGRG